MSGNNIFVGVNGRYGSGIYLSTNNGSSWTALNNGLNYEDVRTISIKENNIFIGTDNGVFLSTINGEDWII